MGVERGPTRLGSGLGGTCFGRCSGPAWDRPQGEAALREKPALRTAEPLAGTWGLMCCVGRGPGLLDFADRLVLLAPTCPFKGAGSLPPRLAGATGLCPRLRELQGVAQPQLCLPRWHSQGHSHCSPGTSRNAPISCFAPRSGPESAEPRLLPVCCPHPRVSSGSCPADGQRSSGPRLSPSQLAFVLELWGGL